MRTITTIKELKDFLSVNKLSYKPFREFQVFVTVNKCCKSIENIEKEYNVNLDCIK